MAHLPQPTTARPSALDAQNVRQLSGSRRLILEHTIITQFNWIRHIAALQGRAMYLWFWFCLCLYAQL